MAQAASKLMANSMLMFSACLCLNSTNNNFRYARGAFKLYLIASCFGILDAVFQYPTFTDISEVVHLPKIVWVWCYCLGIPLLASDLCLKSDFLPDFGPFHLAIPLYTIMCFHGASPKIDALLLSVSHSVSIMVLGVCSAFEGHLCGYALAFLHFFTMWRMGFDEKSHTDWAMNMTLSNFLSLNLIEWF